MSITVNFRGRWADCINTDIELDLPIRLAIFNAGHGHGYRIKYSHRPKGESYVYNPYIITLYAETGVAIHYDKTGETITSNYFEIEYEVASYSLRSVYEGTLKALEKAEFKVSEKFFPNIPIKEEITLGED